MNFEENVKVEGIPHNEITIIVIKSSVFYNNW